MVIKFLGWSLIIVAVWFCITLCQKPEGFDEKEHIQYVDRVFMGEPNDYTFIITHEDKSNTVWRVKSHFMHVEIFNDVPSHERMYVKYKKVWKQGEAIYQYIYIHIHDLKDVEGGGWDHGKFGQGRTQVIE